MAFVYVFQSGDGNYFKIGRTKDEIEKRRKALSTGNPKELKLFDHIETDHDSEVEKYLHKKLYKYYSAEGDAKEFYLVEPGILKEALDDAREYEVDFLPLKQEAKELAKEDSNGEYADPDDEALEMYRKLIDIRGQMDWLKIKSEILETKIKNRIGQMDGIKGIASWKTQVRFDFNKAKFEEQYPELHEEFIEQKKVRAFNILY